MVSLDARQQSGARFHELLCQIYALKGRNGRKDVGCRIRGSLRQKGLFQLATLCHLSWWLNTLSFGEILLSHQVLRTV